MQPIHNTSNPSDYNSHSYNPPSKEAPNPSEDPPSKEAPYSTRDSQRTEPTEEEIELWKMAGGTHEGVSFGRRIVLAATHFCHIPESILNLVTNVVKLVFTAIACAFSFGQVDLFNNEFKLALGRTMINFAGIGVHTVGVVAPVTALKWQMNILESTVEKLKGDTLDDKYNPNVLFPMMMSI